MYSALPELSWSAGIRIAIGSPGALCTSQKIATVIRKNTSTLVASRRTRYAPISPPFAHSGWTGGGHRARHPRGSTRDAPARRVVEPGVLGAGRPEALDLVAHAPQPVGRVQPHQVRLLVLLLGGLVVERLALLVVDGRVGAAHQVVQRRVAELVDVATRGEPLRAGGDVDDARRVDRVVAAAVERHVVRLVLVALGDLRGLDVDQVHRQAAGGELVLQDRRRRVAVTLALHPL